MTPEELFSHNPLLSAIGPVDAGVLLRQAETCRYRRGEVIFHKDDPGDRFYAVLSGRVFVTSDSAQGRALVLNRFGPGDLFGEIALLDGRGRTATATARVQSDLLVLRRDVFRPFVQQRPQLIDRMLGMLCDRLRRTTELVEDSAFLDVAGRLAKLLLALSLSHIGKACPVEAFHQELADMLGVSREAVSKQLYRWRDQGVLRLGRGQIIVASAGPLERLASYNRSPVRKRRPGRRP